MNWIDYSDLESSDGAFSRLFVDYVSEFEKVGQFYGGDPQNPDDWRRLLDQVRRHAVDRSSLTRILSRQNRDLHCGVKTLANIDHLRDDNCVAVVTGQQVGLFTGPMYTIYKSITAIKLAEKLGRDYPDHKFVPVFWLAGEDHDFEEVSSVSLFHATGELVHVDYKHELKHDGSNYGAVGEIVFDESIDEVFKIVDQALQPTEFKGQVLELFKTAYQKGMTFNKAFVHLMNVLLEDSGLIFLDSNDKEVKELLRPVFRRELAETPKSCQLVIDQSAILERQYHAQVKPRSINLFLFHEKGRYPIEPHPDGYFLKGTRQHFSKDALAKLLDDQPELFSPNVVLRPLCQDTLLPTVAYVAGPSELAYFGQFSTLYKELGIPQPMIYPRASVTIVEEKVEKVLTRYSLEPLALFGNLEFLKQQIAEQISDFKADDFFSGTMRTIDSSLNQLTPALQTLDPTLLPALENTLGKIHSHLNLLKEKTVAAQKRQHEVSLRQIDKAASNLFPESDFQERHVNVIYFLNKYGPEFLRWVFSEVQIDKLKHQLLEI